ncbi:MAG: molybdopterin molybdotransferase MoeA [Desulfobacteraceae bacterium]|nr:molybdopterin molybdotransferase MoeA [Desulfobacteraceae bacterium]
MRCDIGFDEALGLTLENVFPMASETIAVDRSVGRVAFGPVHARVDSPSVNASLKDGYAVLSADVETARPDSPVHLALSGVMAAGDRPGHAVFPGKAIRILSGAAIPPGADAVVAEEFTDKGRPLVAVHAPAEPGRNILEKGTDVHCGECICHAGGLLTPQVIGLMVAAGIFEVPVFRRPEIGLLATGSEILLPGKPFEGGKLYASNVALQQAWLADGGFDVKMRVSGDSRQQMAEQILGLAEQTDVLVTSGGAWKGDRDLVVRVLEDLGCKMIFHRVRMGPGKAAGMGILGQKPVFCLPGGPASNETAFLFMVYPAIRKMAGMDFSPYLHLHGRLESTVRGQADWTQFVQCDISRNSAGIVLHPKKLKSRMAAMAKTPAVIVIAEGVEQIDQGSRVSFTCFDPSLFMHCPQARLQPEKESFDHV